MGEAITAPPGQTATALMGAGWGGNPHPQGVSLVPPLPLECNDSCPPIFKQAIPLADLGTQLDGPHLQLQLPQVAGHLSLWGGGGQG